MLKKLIKNYKTHIEAITGLQSDIFKTNGERISKRRKVVVEKGGYLSPSLQMHETI
jgi:hypothetical protein